MQMMKKLGCLLFLLFCFSGYVPSLSLGAEYNLKEVTPPVKQALENRRDRFATLKELKAQGAVGENFQGYVVAISDDADVAKVVEAENADRKLIYTTIVAQNSLPADSLVTVEKVFGQVQRDKAEVGDRVQNENGDWVEKQ